MPDLEDHLFRVFDFLRRQSVPLGISEYLIVLELIRAGIGIESPETLKRTCRLVWTKSPQDQELLERAFQANPLLPSFQVKPGSDSDLMQDEPDSPRLPDRAPGSQPKPPSAEESMQEAGSSTSDPQPAAARVLPPIALPSTHEPMEEQKYSFQLIPRMPIQSREMASAWRQLRRLKRGGTMDELDIEGTIAQICKMGIFMQPVFRARRRNQARLLLLVDVKGSMSPYQPFTQTVVDSIQRSGLLGQVKTLFFNNVPERFLFSSPGLVDPIPLEQGLVEYARTSSVLILSDAGASRGNYVERRLTDTRQFLQQLAACSYLYAWINPLPIERWARTTAAEIARFVPMFPINRDGLNDAVSILRGHPTPTGGRFDER